MARLPLTSTVQPKALGLLSCHSVLLFGMLTNKSRLENLDFHGKATTYYHQIFALPILKMRKAASFCVHSTFLIGTKTVFWSTLGKVPRCSSVVEWFWHPPEVNYETFQELNSSGSWKILSWTWNSKWSWVSRRRGTTGDVRKAPGLQNSSEVPSALPDCIQLLWLQDIKICKEK